MKEMKPERRLFQQVLLYRYDPAQFTGKRMPEGTIKTIKNNNC